MAPDARKSDNIARIKLASNRRSSRVAAWHFDCDAAIRSLLESRFKILAIPNTSPWIFRERHSERRRGHLIVEVCRMPRLTTVAHVIQVTIIGAFVGCASNTPTAPSTPVSQAASAANGVSTRPTLGASSVEFEGVITAVDAALRMLTVASMSVNVPAGTPIRHGDRPLQFTDLHLGDRVEIQATQVGATITATSVNDETEPGGVADANDDEPPGHDADDDHGDNANDGPNHDANEGPGHDGGDAGHDGHGGSGRH
jgi:uncharacterized protein DUF5666